MRSELPKILHPLAGKPLLQHVYEAARSFDAADIHIVYGHGGEQVPKTLSALDAGWVLQAEQHGTGHAMTQVLPSIGADRMVLILYGDVPLISPATLQTLVAAGEATQFGLLTIELPDPTGYGRIIRDADNRVTRIVEQKDASDEERAVCEINTGMMAVPAALLNEWLHRVNNENAQGEFYLTDVVELAVADDVSITTVQPGSPEEVMGINDRIQLAELERYYQSEAAKRFMRDGVTIADPERLDIRGDVSIGRDVTIDVNVVLEGTVAIDDGARIGPNNVIRDAHIGKDTVVLANCVIEEAIVGAGSRIGPFARLRPEARLAEDVHIGNFVEIKKSDVGVGSKVNHLTYIGDTEIGRDVNVGAGTITCNYDGAYKHKTIIGDRAFIGSDVQLVAPVTVGADATIGAGTTVAQDAPDGKLTVGRAKQRTIDNWSRPVKKK